MISPKEHCSFLRLSCLLSPQNKWKTFLSLQYTIIRGKEGRPALLNAIFQGRHPFNTFRNLINVSVQTAIKSWLQRSCCLNAKYRTFMVNIGKVLYHI